MNANHFKALLKNLFVSFVFGLLYVFAMLIFFSDVTGVDGNLNLFIGIFLVIVSCGVINVIVLPIITLCDRKYMDSKTFMELMNRYMPIFAAPFMIVFGVFVLAEIAEPEILMYVFLVMLVSYTNLFVYLKPPNPQGGNDDATENTSVR